MGINPGALLGNVDPWLDAVLFGLAADELMSARKESKFKQNNECSITS